MIIVIILFTLVIRSKSDLCNAGYYLKTCLNENSTCVQCPAGYYCEDENNEPIPCSTTKYNDQPGSTSVSSCLECEEGFYSDREGSSSCIECKTGFKCTGGELIRCDEGYYSNRKGLETCLECPEGYSCGNPAEAPIICPVGSFSESGSIRCTPCEDGWYSLLEGSGSCSICEVGIKCSKIENSREVCDLGYFREGNSSLCSICDSTKYSITQGASTCDPCPNGHFCNNFLDRPSLCPPGTISTEGSGICSECEKGTYSTVYGSMQCSGCPGGFMCPIPNNSPIPCPEGTYSTPNSTTCTSCPSGFYCISPVDDPEECPKGKYSNGGSTECKDCEFGMYANLTGSQNCIPCPEGNECITSSSSPVMCIEGEYSFEFDPECHLCPPGTYGSLDKSTCVSCDLGSKCNDPTTVGGELCPKGFYTDIQNSTECKICPKGKTSTQGSSSCMCCPAGQMCIPELDPIDCEQGTYSIGCSEVCSICPPGYFCDSTSELPKPCPIGSYSGYNFIECENCPGGTSCLTGFAPFYCKEGYTGQNTTCAPIISGFYLNNDLSEVQECDDGYYSTRGSAECTKCPSGYSCDQKNIPVPCPQGKYSLGGNITCTPCDAGKSCLSTSQVPLDCPWGSYSLYGDVECTPCPPGYECSDRTTTGTKCVAGKWSVGMQISCYDCPLGFYCPKTDSFPVRCSPGYYNNIVGAVEICTICPAGSFCKDPELDPTLPENLCQNGTYSLEGQTSCELCPEGYDCTSVPISQCLIGSYSPEGTLACLTCESGMYCENGRMYLCPLGEHCDLGIRTLCSAGTYGINKGQSIDTIACDTCPPGYFCEEGLSDIDESDQCPPGYFCPGGVTDTTVFSTYACRPGFYNQKFGAFSQASCQTCPPGYNCGSAQDHYTRSPCPAGRFCPGGVGIFNCPAGTYNPHRNRANITDCILCPAGAFCIEASTTYDECDPGTYNPHPGMGISSACKTCPPGYICPYYGMITYRHYPCPIGYFCDAGRTDAASADICPAGTFSTVLGLKREEECHVCYEGYVCLTTGIISCPEGYFCPGAPKKGDGNNKEYMMGYYDGRYTSVATQYPCPEGTFGPSGIENLKHESECAPCPAGSYCIGIGETTVSGTCSEGYYCPENSTTDTMVECPEGTYNPSTGGGDESVCLDCPLGKYCEGTHRNSWQNCPDGSYSNVTNIYRPGPNYFYDDDKSCRYCPQGYSCSAGEINPQECGVGFYSKDGASSCDQCEPGHYCPDAATSYDKMMNSYICPAGLFCPVGQDSHPSLFSNACSKGNYCPEGINEPVPCPAGTYGSYFGMKNSMDCIDCPAGSYCVEGETVPVVCDSGCYCPFNSTSSCEWNCPKGTYRLLQGGQDITACSTCTNGYFCGVGTTDPEICPIGFYCIAGVLSPEPCPFGTYGNRTGLIHESECTLCPPGYYCDELGLVSPSGICSAGHYCELGAVTKAPQGDDSTGGGCPRGGYCPEGAKEPASCPSGTFNNFVGAKSDEQCSDCLPGFYCLLSNKPEPTGPCRAGYYCDGASITPEQHEVTDGYYSVEGSSAPIPCPPGTFTEGVKSIICDSCTAGSFCGLEASTSGDDCPKGSYCPEGSITPTKCPPGTYGKGIKTQNATQCRNCPTSKYCPYYGMVGIDDDNIDEVGDCLAGYFCSEGSNVANPELCPKGSYCEAGVVAAAKCPSGTYSTHKGLKNENQCLPCLPGKYCDASSGGLTEETGECDDGYYCKMGISVSDPTTECPVGHFCQSGSSSPTPCPESEYQNEVGMSDCKICPTGEFCIGQGDSGEQCPEGFYCEYGTSFLTGLCPLGSYSNDVELITEGNCTLCPGGKYCSGYALTSHTQDCFPGYYCQDGSKFGDATIGTLGGTGGECPAGFYCDLSTEDPEPCPVGTYSNLMGKKIVDHCSKCKPGHYCDKINQTEVINDCLMGYYCSLGAIVPNPVSGTGAECPKGSYCETGAIYPSTCPEGTFTGSKGNWECQICTERKYCLEGTEIPSPCPNGYFCPNGTRRVSKLENGCPEGTYSNIQELSSFTQCNKCSTGKICSVKGLTTWNDVCPSGMYCSEGVKNYLGEISVNGGFSTVCQKGFYCEEGTTDPSPCPKGYYNDKTGATELGFCMNCPSGYFCDDTGLFEPTGECDPGYYCVGGAEIANVTDGVTGNICPEGHYCPTGSVQPIACQEGKFNNETGMVDCLECPSGFYCGYGTSVPIECISGHYCEESSRYPESCPPGSYNPDTESKSISSCILCDKGKYCSLKGLSSPDGVCVEGYFCQEGSIDSRGTIGVLGGSSMECQRGKYCPEGTTEQKSCPSGTYNPSLKMFNVTDCLPCTPGWYCEEEGMINPTGECFEGFYCPEGQNQANSTEFECDVGHYCKQGSVFQKSCADGYYQDEKGKSSCKICPESYYCSLNCSSPIVCPITYYCPEGSGFPSRCPHGTYSEIDGLFESKQCLVCPEGYYCREGMIIDVCNAGYWCTGGSSDPSPVNETFGDLCPQGKYCVKGANSSTLHLCPVGTVSIAKGGRTKLDCLPCPAGYICPEGSIIAPPCPVGKYCKVLSDPILCPQGTYNPNEYGEDVGACLPCDAGYICNSEGMDFVGQRCPVGYFCPTGTINPIECPIGTFQTQDGGRNITACLTCPEGFYCDELSLVIPKECPSKFYCPEGTMKPYECPAGSYCQGDNSEPTPCEPGHYCPYKSKNQIKCTGAVYCTGNNSFPELCPQGWIFLPGNQLRVDINSSCSICPPGMYWNSSLLSNEECKNCTAGFVCTGGSINGEPTTTEEGGYVCPKGSYCLQGLGPTLCPIGTFQNQNGMVDCRDCPDNHYSDELGLEHCKKCGPSSIHLDEVVTDDGNGNITYIRTKCQCLGQNREYHYSDGFCVCKKGFGVYDNYELVSSLDGTEDCIELLKDQCSNSSRDIEGNCIKSPMGYCDGVCMDEQEGELTNGLCQCSPIISNECDGYCTRAIVEENMISFYQESDDSSSEFFIGDLEIQTDEYVNEVHCHSDMCSLSFVKLNENGFVGIQSPTITYVNRLFTDRKGGGSISGEIYQPFLNIRAGDVVFWDISNGVYPVFVKDSLFNVFDEFDNGKFRIIKEKVDSSFSDVFWFMTEFLEPGVFTFASSENEKKIMLVNVMDTNLNQGGDSRRSAQKGQFFGLNETSLSENDITTTEFGYSPSWNMVGFLVISFMFFCTAIVTLVHYFRNKLWAQKSLILKEIPAINIGSKNVRGSIDLNNLRNLDLSNFNVRMFFDILDQYEEKMKNIIQQHHPLFKDKYDETLVETNVIRDLLLNKEEIQKKIINFESHERRIKEMIKNRDVSGIAHEINETRMNALAIYSKDSDLNVEKQSDKNYLTNFLHPKRKILGLFKKGTNFSKDVLECYDKFGKQIAILKDVQDLTKEVIENVVKDNLTMAKKRIKKMNENTMKILQEKQKFQVLKVPQNLENFFRKKVSMFLQMIFKKYNIFDNSLELSTKGKTEEHKYHEFELIDQETDTDLEKLEKKLKRGRVDWGNKKKAELEKMDVEFDEEIRESKDLVDEYFKRTTDEHIGELKDLLKDELSNDLLTEDERNKIIENSKNEIHEFMKNSEAEKLRQMKRIEMLLREKKRKAKELLNEKHGNENQRLNDKEEFERKQHEYLENQLQSTPKEDINGIKKLLQEKIQKRNEFVEEQKESENDDLVEHNQKLNRLLSNQDTENKEIKESLKKLRKESQKRIAENLGSNPSDVNKILGSFKKNNEDFDHALTTEMDIHNRNLLKRLEALEKARREKLAHDQSVVDKKEIDQKMNDLKVIKGYLGGKLEDENAKLKEFKEEKRSQELENQSVKLKRIEGEFDLKKERIESEIRTEENKLETEANQKKRDIEDGLRNDRKKFLAEKEVRLKEKLDDPKLTESEKSRLFASHQEEIEKFNSELNKDRSKQLQDINDRIEEKKRIMKEKLKKRLMEEEKRSMIQQQELLEQFEENKDDDDEEEEQVGEIKEVILSHDKLRKVKELQKKNEEEVKQVEQQLKVQEEKNLQKLAQENKKELEENKKEVMEKSKLEMKELQDKISKELENSKEEERENILSIFEKEKVLLKEKQHNEMGKFENAFEERLRKKKEALKKRNQEKLQNVKIKVQEKNKRVVVSFKMEEEKKQVLELLEAKPDLVISQVVSTVLKVRHSKEYEELNNKELDTTGLIKEKIDMKKRHLEEERALLKEVKKSREGTFEDSELADFERKLRDEQDIVMKQIEEQEKIIREEINKKIAEEEKQIKIEMEKMKKEADEKKAKLVEEIMSERKKLKEVNRQSKAREAKEVILGKNKEDMENFEDAISQEMLRQNDLLLKMIEQSRKKKLLRLKEEKMGSFVETVSSPKSKKKE